MTKISETTNKSLRESDISESLRVRYVTSDVFSLASNIYAYELINVLLIR